MTRYLALLFLVRVAGRLPTRVLYAAAAVAGTLAWHASRRVRAVTRDHARHVLGAQATDGERDAVARACARSAAAYYADFAHYSRASADDVLARMEHVEGWELLVEARDRGRGVVVVSAHLGCPELIGQAAVALNVDFAAITEPLRPQRVHDFVHRIRRRHGVGHFAADLAGLRAAHAHLRRGGTLGVLVDRDVLGSGRPYPFFGEPARLPTGAVELALRTGAPLLACWVLRGSAPDRTRVRIEPVPLPAPSGDRAADVDAGMRAVIVCLERAITGAPGQWFPLTAIWDGWASDRTPASRTLQ